MSTYEDAVQEYYDTAEEWMEAELAGEMTASISARRMASVRLLHALDSPWTNCPCAWCAD